MTGDCHVRFCERLRVKFPLPTRRSSNPSAGSGHPLGSALILIILAALGIAQASLALPSFAQNLHKICTKFTQNLFLERKELLEGPLVY